MHVELSASLPWLSITSARAKHSKLVNDERETSSSDTFCLSNGFPHSVASRFLVPGQAPVVSGDDNMGEECAKQANHTACF